MHLKEEVVGDSKKNGDRKTFPLRAKFWRPNPVSWLPLLFAPRLI